MNSIIPLVNNLNNLKNINNKENSIIPLVNKINNKMLDENNCSRIVGNVDIVEKNNELKANFKKANRCDVIENLKNKKSIKNNYADIDDAIILNVRNDNNLKKIDDDNKCGCSCTQILSIDDVKNLKRAENVIYAHNEKDKIFDTCKTVKT